jgi:GNAT superfamily N-acetyltransferase
VAASAGGITGFAAIKLAEEKGLGELYMIALDARYQNNGVGAQLMSFSLDRMRDRGMTVAMVETGGDPGHAPARHVYEKTGFTPLPIARYLRRCEDLARRSRLPPGVGIVDACRQPMVCSAG